MNSISHKMLVKIAEGYLYKTKGCGFAFTELTTSAREIPDAIGWKSGVSYLIECKTSRADYKSDFKKLRHRLPKWAMGDYRYYLCPEGLIKKDELPEHYGLIYVNNLGKTRTIVEVDKRTSFEEIKNGIPIYLHRFDKNKNEEMRMMYSALRRLKLRGVLKMIYDGK